MKKLFTMVLFLFLAVALSAKEQGLTQENLIAVSPNSTDILVANNSTVDITFNKAISSTSIHKNTITLKLGNQRIDGSIYTDRDSLTFTPNSKLVAGTYNVTVHKLKFEDATQSDMIQYSFSVSEIQNIHIEPFHIEEDEQASIELVTKVALTDGTLHIVSNPSFTIQNSTIASIQNNTLQGLQEGTTTIQAEYNGVTSDKVTIDVYKNINGYTLPHEPDEQLNNSTLLGIDANNNGVRDDVERYVIQRYVKDPEFPKTKTALAMQYAWAEQKIIENPVIESKQYSDDAIDCQYYWFDKQQYNHTLQIIELSKIDFNASVQETIKSGKWRNKHKVFNDTETKDKIFNTRERIERNFEFNQACSGHIFNGREQSLDNCQINIDELGE